MAAAWVQHRSLTRLCSDAARYQLLNCLGQSSNKCKQYMDCHRVRRKSQAAHQTRCGGPRCLCYLRQA